MRPRVFWLSSIVVAAALGGLFALVLPYGFLGLEGIAERQRAWLLTVFTAGIMAICFGASGLLMAVNPIGVREIAESGSVLGAIGARRDARAKQDARFYNFAGWTTTTGCFLLLVYFAGWLSLGR